MEINERYELILRDITSEEYGSHLATYEEYKPIIAKLLGKKRIYAFEEDVLMEQEEAENFSEHPDRYMPAYPPFQKRNDKFTKAWYDLWANYKIVPDDADYDFLFVCKLRNLDLFEIDHFLDYQLANWYDNNAKKITRFLQLVLRKHGKKLLDPEYIQTINEWISEKEKQPALEGTEKAPVKIKNKYKRGRNEKSTVLNQEQNALLIYCLMRTKIILGEQYLEDSEIGQAFSILTGYSMNSIRRKIPLSEIGRIASPKNIDAVSGALKNVLKFIEDKITPEE